MIREMRSLIRTFSRSTQRKLVVAVLGSLILGVVEIVGILTIVPLMQLLTGASAESSSAIRALSGLTGSTDTSTLILASAALMFTIFFAKGAAGILFRWWILGFVYEEESETSQELISYYVAAPYWLHLQRNSSELLRTMNESVSTVFSNIVVGAVTAISEAATILLILLTLFVVTPGPTLGFALYFGLASYGFVRFLRNKSATYGRAMNDASLAIYQTGAQILGGVKEIKVRNNQNHFTAEFGRARSSYSWARRRVTFVNEMPKYFLEIFFITGLGLSTVALFAWADPDQALPLLALLAAAGFRILPSVARFLGSFNGIRVGLPALDAVMADITAAQEIDPVSSDLPPPLAVRHQISLDKVSFRYRGAAANVLHDISLTIPAGSSLAVLGTSGAGKSTLVDVILGLHEPVTGRITVDGTDIREHMVAWQQAIGFVPQDVYLLDATIRANIAFGEAPDRIDEAKLEIALARAQLVELVTDLPDGLDTVVGERGTRLSGGQRQRIGIARALYLQPQVLVLDEATSALDSQTESLITASIEGLRGVLTLVVVAHRLSTVRTCDYVVFLEHGVIAAAGTFAQVAAANREFAKLIELGRLDFTGAA